MNAVKERPILFSGEMVRAILEGRKTQTRRVIKPRPIGEPWYWEGDEVDPEPGWFDFYEVGREPCGAATCEVTPAIRCPYGKPGDREWQTGRIPAPGFYYVRGLAEDRPVYLQWIDPEPQDMMTGGAAGGYLWGWNESDDPEAVEMEGVWSESLEWKRPGDRLWVRETFATWSNVEGLSGVDYRATPTCNDADRGWKPSIHMPRWASRILLEVEEVRVERVQEISIGDINAEGVACSNCWTANTPYIELPHGENCKCDAKFMNIWDSINAKRGYGWDANPWVWVIEFRRVEP